jgi:hypothetical protein
VTAAAHLPDHLSVAVIACPAALLGTGIPLTRIVVELARSTGP